MKIKRSGSQPFTKGPAEWFTGDVRIDPLFPAAAFPRLRPVGDVRTRRAYRLAYLPAGPENGGHGRGSVGAARSGKSGPAM
jgi:hypothetical protein